MKKRAERRCNVAFFGSIGKCLERGHAENSDENTQKDIHAQRV